MQKPITREQVEGMARIYRNNKDAGLALGNAMRSFGRLCRKYDIEKPHMPDPSLRSRMGA